MYVCMYVCIYLCVCVYVCICVCIKYCTGVSYMLFKNFPVICCCEACAWLCFFVCLRHLRVDEGVKSCFGRFRISGV